MSQTCVVTCQNNGWSHVKTMGGHMSQTGVTCQTWVSHVKTMGGHMSQTMGGPMSNMGVTCHKNVCHLKMVVIEFLSCDVL